MRVHAVLLGGPYENQMVVVDSVDGDWPLEIRVALSSDETEMVDTSIYRRHDVVAGPVRTIFYGAYRYIRNKMGAATLITVRVERYT